MSTTPTTTPPPAPEPIAIVGAACRLPGGVRTLEAYWQLLRAGTDAVTSIDAGRWALDRYAHPRPGTPGRSYTWAAGVLDAIDRFEPQFFGISPREAQQMDPQQRVLLELAWEALEHGAQAPDALAGRQCGVFIGISATDYADRRFDDPASGDAYAMSGTTLSVAANRISHCLDLRGPSMAIDTACSSSLVALHLACQSLWRGECTSVLAGGMHLLLSPFPYIGFSAASMLSPRGRSRPFAAGADGYARGEGGALVFLKPLADALRARDPVLATILATGVNTSGGTDALSVPGASAQTALLEQVHRACGLTPQALSYVEAHGTGTPVGDPIEAAAIGNALGIPRGSLGPLPIGSVKGNIGHLEPASGIAGLLKVVLQLQHGALAPGVHLSEPNPKIDFQALNLRVVDRYESLAARARPHVMAVSSFGFGGANAHAVLAQAPARPRRARAVRDGAGTPLLLSAHSKPALQAMAAQFATLLEPLSASAAYDVLWTCATRRARHRHRLVVDGPIDAGMIAALRDHASGSGTSRCISGSAEGSGGLAFVFTGNGAQWAGMGRALLEESATFRDRVAEVQALLAAHAPLDLAAELRADESSARMHLTEIAQPTLFAVQVGLLAMLEEQGVTPDWVFGHSVGEIAAAHAAGALDLADAVRVIALRSRAQARTQGAGRMLALGLDRDRAAALAAQVDDALEIAAINAPNAVTLAGPAHAISALEARARTAGHRCQQLDLDYAFHSRAMDGIEHELLGALADLDCAPGDGRFISTVTGAPCAGTALDARYWWRNIREPVQFHAAVNLALQAGASVFVEIGPRPLLRSYIAETARAGAHPVRHVPTVDLGATGTGVARRVTFEAFCAGREPALRRLFPHRGRAVALPAYPWQRERYWYAPTRESAQLITATAAHPLLDSAGLPDEPIWDTLVDLDLQPWLADHRVQDTAVFPAAAYVEMALAGAAQVFHAGTLAVDGLRIHTPMLLGDGETRCVRMSVDRDDGRILIRSRRRLSDERWVLHVQARVLAADTHAAVGTAPAPSLAGTASEQRTARHLDAASHYARTAGAGLDYGPAFRTVQAVDIADDLIEAALALAPHHAPQFDGFWLAPPLLDGAFQALLHAAADDAPHGHTFVPVAVEHIRVRAGGPQPTHAQVRITGRGARTVVADVLLLGTGGQVFAALRGCRMRALGKPAPTVARPPVYRFVTEVTDVASPAQRSARLDPAPLSAALREAYSTADRDGERSRFHREVVPLLEALGCALVVKTLRALCPQNEADFDVDATCAAHQIAGPARARLERCLALLARNGLSSTGSDLPHGSEFHDPGLIWRLIAADYPQYLPELSQAPLYAHWLRDELLSPHAPALDAAAMTSGRTRVLATSPGARISQHAVRRAIRPIITHWPAHQRLRILDCGGAGGWLRTALGRSALPDNMDWVITSAESGRAEAARLVASEFAARHAADPHEALSTHGGFDLIAIGAGALSEAARDALLANSLDALAAGGVLLVYGQAMQPLQRLFYGGNAASHAAADDDAERLYTVRAWRDALRHAGCPQIEAVHECSDPESPGAAFVLLGALDASVAEPMPTVPDPTPELAAAARPARRVLTLSTAPPHAGAFAPRLHEALRAHAGCEAASARTLAELIAVVERAAAPAAVAGAPERDDTPGDPLGDAPAHAAADGPVTDIVLLAGSVDAAAGANGHDTVPDAAALVSTAMHVDALSLLHLVQALARCAAEPAPRLWLIAPDEADDPRAGTLRGMLRVVMNEHPDLRASLITLAADLPRASAAVRVAAEVLANHDEREIVLGNAGRARLMLQAAELTPARRASSARPAAWTLDPPAHGGLHALRWRACALPLPGPGEALLRTHAIGLNFRDVMFAQGVLPEEMLEGGLAGPTLGLECAGEIVAVGPGVDDLRVGMRVMCFAGQCFATHVVARASACQIVPEPWSSSAAATVPTAFFTALYALGELAQLRDGERVLIHGAAGGVGMAAVQYARHVGAQVFATAGSVEKRAVLEMMGAAHVFDSRSLDFAEQISAITDGAGVDVVLNCLAGEALRRSVQLLGPFGRFLELGKRDFHEDTRLGLRPFRRNITYFGIDADQVLLHRPDIAGNVLERMSVLFAAGALQPLPYREFDAMHVHDAFVHMQQSQHIGKVVVCSDSIATRAAPPAPRPAPRVTLRADASYLVSGGTSGFGLESACWLARRGAGHIVLVSRSGGDAEALRPALARIEAHGASASIVTADVSNASAVAALIAHLEAEHPPLRGVIHAAAIIDDALLCNTADEQLLRVLAAKADGAWHLHQATRSLSLDLFVLYSSATTYLGSPGQGGYVAANAYLEALARHRRRQGLPGVAIAWGPIHDTGHLARHPQQREQLALRSGTSTLDAATALDMLDELLAAEVDNAMVTDIDWGIVKRLLPVARSPAFAQLGRERDEGDEASAQMLRLQIQTASHAEALLLLEQHVARALGAVLRMDPAEVPLDRSVLELGIDSLMGMELISLLADRIGIELPTLLLSEAPSVRQIAAELARRIRTAAAAAEQDGAAPDVRTLQQLASRHAEAVDEATLERLASELPDPPHPQALIR